MITGEAIILNIMFVITKLLEREILITYHYWTILIQNHTI